MTPGAVLNEVDRLTDVSLCVSCGNVIHTGRCGECPALRSIGHDPGCPSPQARHVCYNPLGSLPSIEFGGLFLTIPGPDGRLKKDGASVTYWIAGKSGPYDIRLMFEGPYDNFLFFARDPDGFLTSGNLNYTGEERVILGLDEGEYGLHLWQSKQTNTASQ